MIEIAFRDDGEGSTDKVTRTHPFPVTVVKAPPSVENIQHTAITVGTGSTALLAANPARKYALLVNDSDAVVYIFIGGAAVMNQGIRLNASGGAYEMAEVYGNLDTRAINAISAAGTKLMLMSEG